MNRSLVAATYSTSTPSETSMRALSNGGRAPRRISFASAVLATSTGTIVEPRAIAARTPRRTAAASTALPAGHWFDDRSFADLVADTDTDMGSLLRSVRR